MSDLTRTDIVAMGRVLFNHKLWEEFRKANPDMAITGVSVLELHHIPFEQAKEKFNNKANNYLSGFENKNEELREITKEISATFDDVLGNSLAHLTKEQEDILVYSLFTTD